MRVGEFLSTSLPMPLMRYVQPTATPLYIIIPAVTGVLLLVVVFGSIIIFCVVRRYRKVINNLKKNQDWMNLISKKDIYTVKNKGISSYYNVPGLVEH